MKTICFGAARLHTHTTLALPPPHAYRLLLRLRQAQRHRRGRQSQTHKRARIGSQCREDGVDLSAHGRDERLGGGVLGAQRGGCGGGEDVIVQKIQQ